MAVQLLKSSVSNPILTKLKARETFVCDLLQKSIQIDVYLSYQGQERCFYNHIYTFNENELDSFTWDDPEEKTGLKKACEIINTEVSVLLQGKDITLIKKIDDQLHQFAER